MTEMLRQLQTMAEFQRHLLPRVIPRQEGWEIAVHYAVGTWPGGDYYDFLRLPDGRLVLMVADASDQGAPAAALVAITRVMLHSCPLSSGEERLPFCPLHEPVTQPPHILLGHLNQVLVENSLEEQFLTAFCGVLDPLDGTFHYSNAGHPAPRWWRARHRAVEPIRDAAGLPLGVHGHVSFHHRRIEVEPGDVLLFYTDGLVAAQDTSGMLFGHERLDDLLRETAREGAEAVKTAVCACLEDFLEGRGVEDDVTLVVVERSR